MCTNEYSVRVKYVDRNVDLSISKQCRLLKLNRSSIYYKPVGESELNLKIMFEIDKKLIDTPEYGSRTLADILSMDWEIDINRKRVQRLMRIMGVEAVYPQKRTTFPGNASYIYPYLLRDQSSKSSLVYRYNLSSDAWWLYVSSGNNGLAFKANSFLGAFEYIGC